MNKASATHSADNTAFFLGFFFCQTHFFGLKKLGSYGFFPLTHGERKKHEKPIIVTSTHKLV
jgi:hypothetical protein